MAFKNTLKTTVLLGAIGGLFVAVGSMLGGRGGATIGLLFGLAGLLHREHRLHHFQEGESLLLKGLGDVLDRDLDADELVERFAQVRRVEDLGVLVAQRRPTRGHRHPHAVLLP